MPARWFFAVVALALLLVMAHPSVAAPKKLIEFGWDEPGADDLREHIREMEWAPFDGVVFNIHYRDSHGARQVLEWTDFSATPIAWESLQPALRDIKATRFHRFKDNFLRFNTSPGDVDWFDDFSSILNNAGMAARFARRAHLKGILLDDEEYNSPLFEYPSQKYRTIHSFDDYAAQVRRRGREIMEAFQKEDPGLTLFLTLGYDVAGRRPSDLRTGRYGLLAAFLDGLYEAARGHTVIVDGYESSYSYQAPERFERAFDIMKRLDLAVCAVPRIYLRRLSVGFGVWLDQGWREQGGWHEDNFTRNYHSPEQFERALTAALSRCDRYVWLYTEQPRWFPRRRLPDAYVNAVLAARRANGMPVPGTRPADSRHRVRQPPVSRALHSSSPIVPGSILHDPAVPLADGYPGHKATRKEIV